MQFVTKLVFQRALPKNLTTNSKFLAFLSSSKYQFWRFMFIRSWKPRRIWGMKMGLVETESKRKRSSRGDLEGGGSLLDDARE